MTLNNVHELIDQTVADMHRYAIEHSPGSNYTVQDFDKVLKLLKIELGRPADAVNTRVLRAYKDICVTVVKEYRDASFYSSVIQIADYLRSEFPGFKELKVLGMDYGKANPI